jgi:hypothetical protein
MLTNVLRSQDQLVLITYFDRAMVNRNRRRLYPTAGLKESQPATLLHTENKGRIISRYLSFVICFLLSIKRILSKEGCSTKKEKINKFFVSGVVLRPSQRLKFMFLAVKVSHVLNVC